MFRTGEFSKLSRVSKRLLQYYDEIGLLKPAHVDRFTGYRYYSAHQLPALNRILALKELGLTLNQIQSLLQGDISDDEIHGMLLMKKAESEQRLHEEVQRLRRIEARLEQIRAPESSPEVVIKDIPAQLFYCTRQTLATPDEVMALVTSIRQRVQSTLTPSLLGPFVGVVHTEEFRLHDNDVEMGYYLKKPISEPLHLSDAIVLDMRELPAVKTMATAVQVGTPDLVFVALGEIASWIESNNYRIAGPYRELVLDMPHLDASGEMVIEIQMPVTPAS